MARIAGEISADHYHESLSEPRQFSRVLGDRWDTTANVPQQFWGLLSNYAGSLHGHGSEQVAFGKPFISFHFIELGGPPPRGDWGPFVFLWAQFFCSFFLFFSYVSVISFFLFPIGSFSLFFFVFFSVLVFSLCLILFSLFSRLSCFGLLVFCLVFCVIMFPWFLSWCVFCLALFRLDWFVPPSCFCLIGCRANGPSALCGWINQSFSLYIYIYIYIQFYLFSFLFFNHMCI